jgi:hypothetical protein
LAIRWRGVAGRLDRRQTLEDSVQFMLAGVKDWGGGSGLIDDATILAVEREQPTAGRI